MSHGLSLLITPLLLAARHRFFPAGRISRKTGAIIAFLGAVTILLYLLSLKVVAFFHAQNELGIILSLKIFQMAWIILFAMTIFSCMVSAVSTIFLSRDNEILLASPAPPAALFGMRHLTTSLYAGWMLFLFLLPVFIAYGRVFAAGPWYWPLLPIALAAAILAATGAGMLFTIILVNLFPARRTKDIILYLSVCFGILIYLMFRMLRPEDLVNPERFGHFVEYLSSLATPAAPYLPAAWASNLLSLYLLEREIDFLLLALLLITPVALYILGEVAMQRWFFRGYSKAQESFGGQARFGGAPLAAYQPRPLAWILRKEARMFLRDSTEWAQLFMVGALIVVYLYNFKILPLDRAFIREEYLANLIAFLNLGLSGFVCASLAARFVYPSISAEGRAIVMLQSAPLGMGRYLLRKYLFYLPPFTLLSLLLVLVSNHLLGISGPLTWLSLGLMLPITWAVVAMAIGCGALYADFKATSRAATLGGWGAIFFLLSAMTFEIALIAGAAWPTWRVVKSWLLSGVLNSSDLGLLLAIVIIAALISTAVGAAFFLKGAKALDTLA